MGFIISLVLNTLAVWITAYLLAPHVIVNGWYPAIITAIVLGLVNTFIKPILSILTLPLNLITLGLFSLILNGILILVVSSYIQGFQVDGLFWAIIFSIVLSLLNSVLSTLTGK